MLSIFLPPSPPTSPGPIQPMSHPCQPQLSPSQWDVPAAPSEPGRKASFCPCVLGPLPSRKGQAAASSADGWGFPVRLLGLALWWARAMSCCSISRAAPHEIFIGSIMLFPCQTITEIGSVCVIGERILMAQFLHCRNEVDAPSPFPSSD